MMYCKPGAYQKDKLAYFLICARFALSFNKIGCTSALQKNKQAYSFAVRSVCTIFAPRKSQLLLEDG